MKKKKIIIGISIMCLLIISISLILITNKSSSKVLNSNLNNNKIEQKVPGMFAIMLETERGSGRYEPSTSGLWPDSGYIYNANLSYCEKGSTLTWNDETRSVNLKTNISDKCYLYFDIVPPDVTINTNNNGSYNPSTPATLSCTGADATYNPLYQRIEISSIANKYTSCNLTYQTPSSKTYLNNKIIGLSGQTQGTGQVVNENGYRYEGKNPNNYIWFNNELWRIIGVFDSASHGQSGNLVKIIREESIGGLAWHKSNTNSWSASSLKSLLNGAYYDWDSNKSSVSTYCYGYSISVPGNCNYSEIGINDTYRNMIQNVTWYLRGHSSASATAENFYNYERTTGTVYSGRPTEEEGYIGLMYPSDYGYSVLASSCARTTNLSSYSKSTCAGQSWLYKTGYEWTITPYSSDSNRVFYLTSYGGYLHYNAVVSGNSVRPVLYLKSNVYVVDGNGSISDPYIIGM